MEVKSAVDSYFKSSFVALYENLESAVKPLAPSLTCISYALPPGEAADAITETSNVLPFPLVKVIIELLTDAVLILVNENDDVVANDDDNAFKAYDADSAHDAVPKNEPDISYASVGNCDKLNINLHGLLIQCLVFRLLFSPIVFYLKYSH